MKVYQNKDEALKAIGTMRKVMWKILTRLPGDGYNGDWQQAEDIELASQLSRVVHSSRTKQHAVTISDEAYERLSTLTVGQMGSVTGRKTRDLSEGSEVEPRRVISDYDMIALAEAVVIILERADWE